MKKMPRLENLHVLTGRYATDDFKDREVKEFEEKFPGVKVVKDKYDDEQELNSDWEGYCNSPYHLKVLANELALRLWGKKNEEHYIQVKSDFAKKDLPNTDLISSTYIPQGFTEADNISIDFMNNQRKKFVEQTGYKTLAVDYSNIESLNEDYLKYKNQDDRIKKVINEKSIQIYGKTNEEIYLNEVNRLALKYKEEELDFNESLFGINGIMEGVKESDDLIENYIYSRMFRSKRFNSC